MIRGMTGFGTSTLTHKEIRGLIEIKSLNHRYLDVSFYLPVGFASIEQKIRNQISKELNRGRISVSLKITGKADCAVHLNPNAVSEYLKHTRKLKKDFGILSDLSAAEILKLPGVIETRETLLNPDKLWPSIQKSLQASLKDLVAMRKKEGKSLSREINALLRKMKTQVSKIKTRARKILQAKKSKLTDEEFSSFQKGNDVNEEIMRLLHFIDEVKPLLSSSLTVGKKIDFIAQEMQRETNTIGSKLQDSLVANSVIALKSKIEKIRELAQNIE